MVRYFLVRLIPISGSFPQAGADIDLVPQLFPS